MRIMGFLRTHVPLVHWTADLCTQAVAHKNADMLVWLHSLDPPCPWSTQTISAAAAIGDRLIVGWLRFCSDMPCPWDESCSAAAAQQGDLDLLRWLREHDCPFGATCLQAACRQRDTQVLEWLHTHVLQEALSWDAECTRAAAFVGNLKVLQWLHAHGAPLDQVCLDRAIQNEDLPMAQWLHAHGLPFPASTYYKAAGECRSILGWLHTARVPLPPSADDYAQSCLDFAAGPDLMYLADIGVPIPRDCLHSLLQARKTFCTFHGLLRWCRSAVADPSRGAHGVFDGLAESAHGQQLLVRLSMLPSELLVKIAVEANIQHDFPL